MPYIKCTVSGGVTGTRTAFLKDEKDGLEKYFHSTEEAQAEAERLNRKMNHQYSRASFRYEVTR